MYRRGMATLIAIPLVIAACTPAVTIAPSTGIPTVEPTATAVPYASQDCTSYGACLAIIRVTITGGSRAGGYDAALVSAAGCVRNPFGPNTFEVAEEGIQGTVGFAGPRVWILDAAKAASGTDTRFTILLEFDFSGRDHLTMSPGVDTPLGSGVLTLDDRGATASIHAEGTLDDGSTATVDIECQSVIDL